MSVLLGLGASSPLQATLGWWWVIVIALVVAVRDLLPCWQPERGPPCCGAAGIVLFLGALCFVVFLTEGALLDWSAVLLTMA